MDYNGESLITRDTKTVCLNIAVVALISFNLFMQGVLIFYTPDTHILHYSDDIEPFADARKVLVFFYFK